jgi:hypothetical protein
VAWSEVMPPPAVAARSKLAALAPLARVAWSEVMPPPAVAARSKLAALAPLAVAARSEMMLPLHMMAPLTGRLMFLLPRTPMATRAFPTTKRVMPTC